MTIKNRYPLPLISELIDQLTGAKYFSKMDVRWGYNNIQIKEGDTWKAAFRMNRGLFKTTGNVLQTNKLTRNVSNNDERYILRRNSGRIGSHLHGQHSGIFERQETTLRTGKKNSREITTTSIIIESRKMLF